MPTVNTVRGPVDTAGLGQTLMHEHIILRTPGIKENWPHLWDGAAAASTARERLKELEARPISTLVDVTPPDIGRDVDLLVELQAHTQINIIVCTGMYLFPSPYWFGRSADEMAQVFMHDIREGIAGTSVKAGIIKLATGVDGVTPLIETALRAGARAHRATGVPITTHAIPQEMGREQQRIFEDEGVDLSRVVIGHQGNLRTPDFYQKLMDAGSTIGIDGFGIEHIRGVDEPYNDDAERVELIAALCADGYGDRIVLSHDANCGADWGVMDRMIPPDRNPNWHYNHISDDIIPALNERGVSEAQIEQMLVGNPRRIFDAQGAY